MQVEQTERREVPNADSVLKFLTRNPDFFNQHSEVLPRLTIPHHTGQAVSLIEKQVSVLRNKCCTLENSLRDLINISTSQMFSRTLVTSGTTLMSVSAFFFWGTPVIRDIAFALIIGVFIGTYSSIYIAAPVTEWMDTRLRRRSA